MSATWPRGCLPLERTVVIKASKKINGHRTVPHRIPHPPKSTTPRDFSFESEEAKLAPRCAILGLTRYSVCSISKNTKKAKKNPCKPPCVLCMQPVAMKRQGRLKARKRTPKHPSHQPAAPRTLQYQPASVPCVCMHACHTTLLLRDSPAYLPNELLADAVLGLLQGLFRAGAYGGAHHPSLPSQLAQTPQGPFLPIVRRMPLSKRLLRVTHVYRKNPRATHKQATKERNKTRKQKEQETARTRHGKHLAGLAASQRRRQLDEQTKNSQHPTHRVLLRDCVNTTDSMVNNTENFSIYFSFFERRSDKNGQRTLCTQASI